MKKVKKGSKLKGIKLDSARAKYEDADYLDKLTEEELNWRRKFSSEYYGNRFEGEGDLHDTDELKKICTSTDNDARRDILNVSEKTVNNKYKDKKNKNNYNWTDYNFEKPEKEEK